MKPLRATRQSLEQSRNAVTFQEAAPRWLEWQKGRIPKKFHVPLLIAAGLCALMILPLVVLIPVCLLDIQQYRTGLNRELNEKLDREIAAVDQRLRALQHEMEAA